MIIAATRILVLLLLVGTSLHGAVASSVNSRTFPANGKTVAGRFLEYWQATGGLARHGNPVSDEIDAVSPETGKTLRVQYFERSLFELHPENSRPYDVLLARLGAFSYEEAYPGGAVGQRPNTTVGSRLFTETGKRVGGALLEYWQQNGGLPQLGYPISDGFAEKGADGKTYTVQYFERTALELHGAQVVSKLLGVERYAMVAGQQVGQVVPGPVMAVARACHSATLLHNGKVLIAGGMVREGDFSANAELFDPETGRFTPTGSLITGRACHNATLLRDGKVLITGGDTRTQLDSAEIYDPASGAFSATGRMTARRSGQTATLLPDGKVLITGGYNGATLASAELYDPPTTAFSPTGQMSVGRSAHSATLLRDGKVLVVGGGSRDDVYSSAELYDPQRGFFTPTGSMSRLRYKHGAALLPDGAVLVVGGSDARDWRGLYSTAERYDPSIGKFSVAASLVANRFKFMDALATLSDGRLLVAGGATLVELYNPATGSFSAVSGLFDRARFYTTATALPNGGVLIAGGYDNGIVSTDQTWLYK